MIDFDTQELLDVFGEACYRGHGEDPGVQALASHVERVVLAACAAGEWRTDMENAPKDKDVLLAWKWLNNVQCDRMHWDETAECWSDGTGRGFVRNETVFAFATINPPEIT